MSESHSGIAGRCVRVRSGCQVCRATKVKCDENRPECNRCLRLGRTCQYRASRWLTAPIPNSIPHGVSPSCGVSVREIFTEAPSVTAGSIPVAEPASQSLYDVPTPPRHGPVRASATAPIVELSLTPELHFMMTSQDIYLCSTIDLLEAQGVQAQPSYAYFLEEVKPPLIAPVDIINWNQAKVQMTQLAASQPQVNASILSVQALYKAQAHGLPIRHALSIYNAARRFQVHELDDSKCLLPVVFLLSLFEIIATMETDTGLLSGDEAIANALRTNIYARDHTSLDQRLLAWLVIMHAASRRGGGQGILPTDIINQLDLMPSDPPSLLEHTNTKAASLDSIMKPLFSFFLRVQSVSSRIAELSHYHRSRVLVNDQVEVSSAITKLESELDELWQGRPSYMHLDSASVCSLFAEEVSFRLLALCAICKTAYLVEIVEIGRTLSDPPLASPQARKAMREIRNIVDSDLDMSNDKKPSVAHLRPLFLYAIESISMNETQWAVQRIKDIDNPIARSSFFASFAKALAQAQRDKERRVTSRWFCYQAFGMPPPAL